jgi:hypothetical protein
MKHHEQDFIVETPTQGKLIVNVFSELNVIAALEECLTDGKTPLFMPQLVDVVQYCNFPEIRNQSFVSFSQVFTGQFTPDARPAKYVEIYNHANSPLTDLNYLSQNMSRLDRGSMPVTTDVFDSLINAADNKRTFVVDPDAKFHARRTAFYGTDFKFARGTAGPMLSNTPTTTPHGRFLLFANSPTTYDQSIKLTDKYIFLGAKKID